MEEKIYANDDVSVHIGYGSSHEFFIWSTWTPTTNLVASWY